MSVRMLTGRTSDSSADGAFDAHGLFETRRYGWPSTAIAAVPFMTKDIATQCLLWKPDAILSFLWLPDGIATWMTAPMRRVLGTPYFVVAHGVELLESRSTLKKRMRSKLSWLKRSVFQDAAAVFPVSRFTGSLVESECGVDSKRIQTIHNGVDVDSFYQGPKPRDLVQKYALDGKHVFLTVSRLDDYKGIDKAFLALRQVVERDPDIAYVVVGDGPDRLRLHALVRELGLKRNVIFAGAVPAGRLNDYYNLCDTFVLTSRDDRATPNFEGFGIVFLEAAACAKPAIAGNSGGIPDAVVDRATGWLVDPEDESSIAIAMIEAIENPALGQSLGKTAFARARDEFGWDEVAGKILTEVGKHVRN